MTRLAPRRIDELLGTWPVARLATTNPDGSPHIVPIVFARAGDRLWSSVDGKPKAPRELARVRNIRAEPRVTVLLDEYTTDWAQLWWIRVDALARIVHGPDDADDFGVAIKALRDKYPQYETTPVVGESATLLAFEPTQIRSWHGSDRE